MSNRLIAFALFILAFVIGAVGYVVVKTTQNSTQQFQASVSQATDNTSNLNALAGTVNDFLKNPAPAIKSIFG